MTLIFCFTKIFRNAHRQIFGLDKLLQQGYNIILLDMSEMYGGNPTCDDKLMLELRVQCSDQSDLVQFRKKLAFRPVIYICNDTYLSFARKAFEILIRKQDQLLAFKIKPTPFQTRTDRGVKLFFKRVLYKCPVSIVKISRFIYQKRNNYFIPNYFMSTTRYDLPLKALLTVKKKNIIIAHSDDVNEILEDGSKVQTQKRIGVFLDQILPFASKGRVEEGIYYRNLNKTLKRLEKFFDLEKIVIAEHPESIAFAEELRDKFKGFERHRGKTQQLIKNSTVVFAHYSTSIGLAVFYGKPVVLLIDYNLEKMQWISKAIRTYKKMLELSLIDMGQKDFSHLLNIKVNKYLYRDYVSKYMKDSNLKEKSYHYAIRKIVRDLE